MEKCKKKVSFRTMLARKKETCEKFLRANEKSLVSIEQVSDRRNGALVATEEKYGMFLSLRLATMTANNEATLSQNKIYIYIAIKLKNSQNFNQKIVQQLFIYTKYHLYKKYLHISSIKLKDHTNFNQKIVLFRFFLAHKIFIYSQFFY